MQIELTDHELELVKEYSFILDNLGMDTDHTRFNEVQSLIANKIAAKVRTEEVFKRITA